MHMYLDASADLAQWTAKRPDGVTPSDAIDLVGETKVLRYGPDRKAVRIHAAANAAGHRLRWSLPAVDLREYDELRLYLRSDRVGDGSNGAPFLFELRVGGPGCAANTPGNPWMRLLPAFQADTWEFVRLALGDLPPAARAAVDHCELRCARGGFTAILDDIAVVREEPIADVEAALRARLHEQLELAGALVPAAIAGAGGTAPTGPYLWISAHELRFVEGRAGPSTARRDFVPGGYSLVAAAHPIELVYRIDAVGDSRASEARLLEFVLRSFGPRGELVVGGRPTSIEWTEVPMALRPAANSLFFRVMTRQEAGAGEPVRATQQVLVNTDLQALA